MDISNGADKVLVKPDINQLTDLKGKTIAVESTALGVYMLYQLLKAANLEFSDISIESGTINQMIEYAQDPLCSAIITFEPTGQEHLNSLD